MLELGRKGSRARPPCLGRVTSSGRSVCFLSVCPSKGHHLATFSQQSLAKLSIYSFAYY
jgi:hypothetical protein